MSAKPDTGNIQKSESLRIIKLRFAFLHLGALGVFFVPYEHSLLSLAVLVFAIRNAAFEIGYHRYFAHRAFKTSRLFQFILGCLGASGGFRGPLWWAMIHRRHHMNSDMPLDPHSPVRQSTWHAQVGFIFTNLDTELYYVRDLARFPELLVLNKYHYVVPYLFFSAIFCIGQFTNVLGPSVNGASAVIWGFFLSTVFGIHVVSALNTITHGIRPGLLNWRRFDIHDTTTNNPVMALLTFSAGWHNNHHRFPYAARSGFRWWEIDLAYYLLKLLQWAGIVWRLREAPAEAFKENGFAMDRAP